MKHILYLSVLCFPLLLASCEPAPYPNPKTSKKIAQQTDPKTVKSLLENSSDILEDKEVVFLWQEVPSTNTTTSKSPLNRLLKKHNQKDPSTFSYAITESNATEARSSKIHPSVASKTRSSNQDYGGMIPPPTQKGSIDLSGEAYDDIIPNEFNDAQRGPVSTLSIDVDNASYSNIRRYMSTRRLPPANAVRIEEMINYFGYDYPQPKDEQPFSINTELGPCPWNEAHRLIHVGLQGKELAEEDMKPSNLVFLIDASGSMNQANKMPLLKASLELLLGELRKDDRVAIVAYAGAAGLVLPSTPASDRNTILAALNNIGAGGSTAGGEGIHLAYKIALENLKEDGNNRVILATDGDFNVGVTNNDALVRLIEEKREDDIFLTICGFGMGNYKDNRMEQISNAGNGNYFYIDNVAEAEKVFVKEMRSNMFTLAKDVKIQVEFNPNLVKAYRLIGYENRLLEQKDFDDDTKDAGELGAGHTVTALYEVILNDSKSEQEIHVGEKQTTKTNFANNQSDIMAIRFRYKKPKEDKSILIEHNLVKSTIKELEATSDNFRFSASIAGLGMLLRNSPFKGDVSYDMVANLAKSGLGQDVEGYRAEFLRMIKSAKELNISMGMQAGR